MASVKEHGSRSRRLTPLGASYSRSGWMPGRWGVVKLVTGVGKPIVDGYLAFSAFQGSFDFIPVQRRPGCQSCASIT
jgi:hypothetical protein